MALALRNPVLHRPKSKVHVPQSQFDYDVWIWRCHVYVSEQVVYEWHVLMMQEGQLGEM